eukprot:CAMPEP_0174261886 /NCGR_PEP_ID=MMETSP0439-20130205/12598_1 /TAXON_ID=0 /ORGANISM="Stereomyxa ramosa, Strain Chinc5" /LENGTH=302 /DNA_ID=CAMNT_0015346489 /DNA_START=57 /DNA_END=965 /DNA_ORIENTATION=+
MGGSYYDREVSTTTSPTSYSSEASSLASRRVAHQDLDPKGKDIATDSLCPVVLALDVTGSMGDWPLIIWDKLPMFYGQIMMNEYLDDPHVSFAPTGDARSDKAPLQVSDFVVGMDMDDAIGKIYVERGGGAGCCETYELTAYYYLKHCTIPFGSKPLFFFSADEDFYPEVAAADVKSVIGDSLKSDLDASAVMKALALKFNVFVLRKTHYQESSFLNHWKDAVGAGRVLTLSNPKACVDAILGIIAIVGGTKDIEAYVGDMKERGQTEERIEEVKGVLSSLDFDVHLYTEEIQAEIDSLLEC